MENITEGIQKSIVKIAAKLLNEDLTVSKYTKAKAKAATKNVVAPKYVHRIIDGFSKEIKDAMKEISKKSK
jgi:hypothetical protein